MKLWNVKADCQLPNVDFQLQGSNLRMEFLKSADPAHGPVSSEMKLPRAGLILHPQQAGGS